MKLNENNIYKIWNQKSLKQYINDIITETNQLNLRNDARLRKGLFKIFRDELYPLSVFSDLLYKNDIYKIQLIKGNQPYDAIIYKNNKIFEKIEITWPIDGKNDIKNTKDINKRGYSRIDVFTYDEKFNYMRQIILNSLQKKALRNYNETILLIIFDRFPFFSFKNEYELNYLDSLLNDIKSIKFNTKTNYFLVLPLETSNKYLEPVLNNF